MATRNIAHHQIDPIVADRPRRRGFTLTELLIVIAIIAILLAIIFPVFATIQENARQTTTMSKLHDISTKLEQYKLDNHRYPEVLFGYAVRDANGNVVPMDKAVAQQEANDAAAAPAAPQTQLYFPGLYPTYISDVNEFTDPNNTLAVTDLGVTPAGNNIVCPSPVQDIGCIGNADGILVPAAHVDVNGNGLPGELYKADAFDSNPRMTDARTLDYASSYIPRYQLSWTSVSHWPDKNGFSGSPGNPPHDLQLVLGPDEATRNYARQLRWRNPPSDTWVTCTDYHAPNSGVIIALYLDGSTKKIDYSHFVMHNSGAVEPNDLSPDLNGEITTGGFWIDSPADYAH